MNVGGVIVCDDYDFDSCTGATKAVVQFFADKKEDILSLSSGVAFLIKGIAVGKSYFD